MFVVVVHGNPTMWIGIPSVQGDEEEREIGVNVIGGGGTGNPMAFTKIHHRVLCIPIGWSREDDKDSKMQGKNAVLVQVMTIKWEDNERQ